MISGLLKKIFGSRNERLIKQYAQTVKRINAFEPQIQALSDEALRAKTEEFRQRHANGESLDDLLPEAFAVVREAGKRELGMRHFDVQLIGGMVLHYGKIAEMRTGEGKTLVGTLPAYLNAISGKGVHVITVNDYLASRDAEWMGRLHRFLGLTVGVNLSQMDHEAKQAAYAADITYGTNNEFGFDYLRDNMVYEAGQRSPAKSPALALRNCLPAGLSPMLSSGASFRKRCRNEVCAGSRPTSKACSQLHCHIPLKANTCVDGAAKASKRGKGSAMNSPRT